MKCPRCQHENRLAARFCEDCATPLRGASPPTASNEHLKTAVETLRRALTESLAQQTATSEILRVISSSPTDLQPVFDAIVASSVRLCAAKFGVVFRFDGDVLSFVAHHNLDSAALKAYQSMWPRRPEPYQLTGTTILERRVLHVHDVESEPRYMLAATRRDVIPIRTCLGVPILQSGEPIGVINLYRDVVAPFSDRQIDLVKTFADQAVIAIENVRLFKELQTSNRDLTTALDTQTATSDILRVISRSQTDVQPVFDAIVHSAVRLLRAYSGSLSRLEGDQISLVALTSTGAEADATLRAAFPANVQSQNFHALTVPERAPQNFAEIATDPRASDGLRDIALARGHRSAVGVPLLRHDVALGAISVSRREPGGFTDDEIALLQTFADQAVIAIENVRLFTELQEKNQALTAAHAQVTEALEQQTATSEILRVISSSPTDTQPVFDAIAESATRLLKGWATTLFLLDSDSLYVAATHGGLPGSAEEMKRVFPQVQEFFSEAVRARQVRVIEDVEREQSPTLREIARIRGWRADHSVPMLREGQPIGLISATRLEPGPFAPREIDLMKTFADQAVIAIENVRLFTELQTSNRDLTTALDKQTATSEILRV